MTDVQLSANKQATLNHMIEDDLRRENDSHWFADGAIVELSGLQTANDLNGQTAEIIGYDDNFRRYRVRLHSDATVKVVDKKNLQLQQLAGRECIGGTELPLAGMSVTPPPYTRSIPPQKLQGMSAIVPPKSKDSEPPQELQAQSSTICLPSVLPSMPNRPSALQVLPPTSNIELVPSKDVVLKAIDKVDREVRALWDRLATRHSGGGDDVMSEAFLRLNKSVGTCTDVLKMYQTAYGVDEELNNKSTETLQCFAQCSEQYRTFRTWEEMMQDEYNLTKYNIERHGLVGTLTSELSEASHTVIDIARDAGEVIMNGAESMPSVVQTGSTVVRRAAGAVSGAVQHGTQTTANAAGQLIEQSHQHARNTLQNQVVGPMKRTWSLLLTGFVLCFMVPLFGLKAYAPLNSLVGNLGLVYAILCISCPPRFARRRAAKAGLLILWPLILVIFPVVLHYWLTHQPIANPLQPQRWFPT